MTRRISLDPSMPVLLRPDGAVQVGWDPRRAVLVRPPRGLTAGGMAGVLRHMRSPVEVGDLTAEATRLGLTDAGELTALIDALESAGVASADAPRRTGRAAAIRVHGRGPLTDVLVDALRGTGVRVSHSSQPHAAVRAEKTDLVVLADYLVADPRMVRDLHAAQVAHLAVRVRDGTGVVGPLVIPGVTSCLVCADLHRIDRDAAWPALAAQLRDTVGMADHSTVLATVALAMGQVQAVVAAVDGSATHAAAPSSLSATLEFDVRAGSIATRRWPRHPRCSC
ncbi:cyclodehydratase [Mycolicibacterium confluentis]|uniref:Uncharacterized protein n=1 Tax=Mycolicibacterium confluentis TaxID=28047 RepID=A0A7I7Y0A1_9MYCO|nr:cyclodehydratase [Mycolicibacterium confluentis]MCV7319744.1 cyclodehydratase [Mycolicibacterium confluentis]ORV34331.1 cyclodehydratase [Mycolicibacterium confluentis]BBZ34774.1 hypothetical protein MCNF_33790 [Mycolicibacterium confluentis]